MDANSSLIKLQLRTQQLAKARPWCSMDENLYDAERELKESLLMRWRPRFLRWIGATSKTGWEWAELFIVPLTLSIVGWSLGTLNDSVQRKIADNVQRDLVLREYFNGVGSIIKEADQKESTNAMDMGAAQKGLARALTLTTLAQLDGDERDTQRRTLVFQFLREAKVNILSGSEQNDDWGANFFRYDLSRTDMTRLDFTWAWFQEANLTGASLAKSNLQNAVFLDAKLYKANLIGARLVLANLNRADLSRSDLSQADLSMAQLRHAVLDDANLIDANLSYADLSDVRWNRKTRWPKDRKAFAKTILPAGLKLYLGI